jgi:hypothetical protein
LDLSFAQVGRIRFDLEGTTDFDLIQGEYYSELGGILVLGWGNSRDFGIGHSCCSQVDTVSVLDIPPILVVFEVE